MSSPAITLEEIIQFLLEAPMFGDLDAAELSRIVHIMQVQRLRPGQHVFREGDRGDAWYVLYAGEVEVRKDGGLDDQIIAILQPPACFGEMAVLDGSPRSAAVRATRDTTAFRFPRTDFLDLLEDGNLAAYKLVLQMAKALVARQRFTTERLVEVMENLEGDDEVTQELEPIVRSSTVAE